MQEIASLLAAGKTDEACRILQPLCEQGGDTEACFHLAGVYGMLQRFDAAEQACRRALEVDPQHAMAWFRLANAVDAQGRFDEAEDYYRRSIALNPDFPHVWNNLGVTLMTLVRPDDAEQCYRKALSLAPDEVGFIVNLGLARMAQNDLDEAVDCFRRALRYQPEHAEANWSLALALLARGDYQEGWQRYHWRWLRDRKTLRDYSQPLWQGEPIEGKTLLVWHEQGFGDSLQFCRYLKLLRRTGARIVVEIQKELYRLFDGVEGIDTLLPHGTEPPAFDVHLPMASLAGMYTPDPASIPAELPYIHVVHDNPAVREAIASRDGVRVGLVWSGSVSQVNDRRPCPLELFLPLSGIGGVSLFSLRVGELEIRERELMRQMDMTDLAPLLEDFADTAVAVENLDLVISIDTSVPHLAAAMQRPVWILLPFAADWRWGIEGQESPWYPGARLFRQPHWGQWEPVFDEVQQALIQFRDRCVAGDAGR